MVTGSDRFKLQRLNSYLSFTNTRPARTGLGLFKNGSSMKISGCDTGYDWLVK